MRAAAIIVAALFLTLPIVGSLGAPVDMPRAAYPIDVIPPEAYPLFPADFPDGALVLLLAHNAGIPAIAPEPVVVPDGVTLPIMVWHLAMRGGADYAYEDAVALYGGLDARVAAPVLALLVAVDSAWTMRDEAFSALSPEEMQELEDFIRSDDLFAPRRHALEDLVDAKPLIEATILLLDTLDSIVIPQVEAAAQLGIWPADFVADPVGVLRLGGTGDDYEDIDRVVQIDPRGNDVYHNNAGASTTIKSLDPTAHRTPIGISLDLDGNDKYEVPTRRVAQGTGTVGIGILLDLAGDDTYSCGIDCQGYGASGVGYLRDYAGDDTYTARGGNLGSANILGVVRDDAGSDSYSVLGSDGGGYAWRTEGTGLLWDRGGQDEYYTGTFANYRYGWARDGGRGWLVDEGPDLDYYQSETNAGHPHGCNNCQWLAGSGLAGQPSQGRGNDNYGGLAYILARDGGYLDVG